MDKVYPIIGMSPGNSYFKDEVVKKLIQKVVEEFSNTAVLIADVPAIRTYQALGYPENIARREKALPQGNNLRNKVKRAMDELGYTPEQVRIIDWKNEIEDNQKYREKYDKVVKLYETNRAFKIAADEATREVLEHTGKVVSDIQTAITIAVEYLLSELAFMEFGPEFFNVEKVAYVYHRKWPVYESYISGEFDGAVRSKLDSIELKV